MTNIRANYFQVPNVIFDSDLTIYQKVVYINLCRRGNQGGSAYPGYGRIARDCGMSKPQAKRAVKTLEDKGYITVTRRQIRPKVNDTNLYHVNYDIGGISQIPGVVSDKHQGGISQIPKEEPIKNNNKKNKLPSLGENQAVKEVEYIPLEHRILN